jgi:hypothetical protein
MSSPNKMPPTTARAIFPNRPGLSATFTPLFVGPISEPMAPILGHNVCAPQSCRQAAPYRTRSAPRPWPIKRRLAREKRCCDVWGFTAKATSPGRLTTQYFDFMGHQIQTPMPTLPPIRDLAAEVMPPGGRGSVWGVENNGVATNPEICRRRHRRWRSQWRRSPPVAADHRAKPFRGAVASWVADERPGIVKVWSQPAVRNIDPLDEGALRR